MKKRSLDLRILSYGFLLLFFSLAIFTKLLLPLEGELMDLASFFLLGYQKYSLQENNSLTLELMPQEARIVAKRTDEFQDVVLLNKGTRDGFIGGREIIAADALLGFIESAGDDTSKVVLVSSPFRNIDGVFMRSGIPLRMWGRGAGLLEAELPRGVDVVKGDAVYYDKGRPLLIGTVADIIDVASNPFITLIIQHPLNSTVLEKVSLNL